MMSLIRLIQRPSMQGLSLTQLAKWGQCELTFNCQPFAESVQYLTETKDMTENNDSLAVNISGTQDTPLYYNDKEYWDN